MALRESLIEVREVMRTAAEDDAERDQRNAARDERIYKVTVAMAVVAGVTLAAAIITLVVTLV